MGSVHLHEAEGQLPSRGEASSSWQKQWHVGPGREGTIGPCLCRQSHASMHTCTHSKSWVAALTSANTRLRMSIGFCCGTSLESPLGPQGHSQREMWEKRPRGQADKQAPVRGTTPAGSWRLFQTLRCPMMTHAPPPFPATQPLPRPSLTHHCPALGTIPCLSSPLISRSRSTHLMAFDMILLMKTSQRVSFILRDVRGRTGGA